MVRQVVSLWSVPLKISLSALVSVCDRQSTVVSLISQMLDILPELTHRFELVVIDNGSTDATAEIISDLAILYPQMSRVALPRHSDWATVAREGLMHSSGDIVLYRGEHCTTGVGGLSELWQALRMGDVAVTRPRQRASLGSIPSLPNDRSLEQPDWQMVRRPLLDGWLRTKSSQNWSMFLAARGFEVQEVDCRSFGPRSVSRASTELRLPAAKESSRSHVAVSHGTRPTRRPNYLDRIRAFALGE
jgi:hypothetical protein